VWAYHSIMNRKASPPRTRTTTPEPLGPAPEGIEALVALADTGSLGRAAPALRSSQPTIGRRIRALEDAVGQALVVPQGRRLVLTPAGEELVAAGREVVQAQARFGLVARALGRELSGQVRVSASEAVATELLPTWVAELRATHPGLQVAIVAEDRVTDVAHREADLAVRMFRPKDPDLVAVKLGMTPLALWASRAYLARHGHPHTRADLVHHDAIGFDRDTLFEGVFRAIAGELPESRVALRTDHHAVAIRGILAGVGVGAIQRVIAKRYPDLIEVASDISLPSLEAWLVTTRDLRRIRATRAAFEHLRAWFTNLLESSEHA
jgi:DNA-binding transcriptional LysR family regulator